MRRTYGGGRFWGIECSGRAALHGLTRQGGAGLPYKLYRDPRTVDPRRDRADVAAGRSAAARHRPPRRRAAPEPPGLAELLAGRGVQRRARARAPGVVLVRDPNPRGQHGALLRVAPALAARRERRGLRSPVVGD